MKPAAEFADVSEATQAHGGGVEPRLLRTSAEEWGALRVARFGDLLVRCVVQHWTNGGGGDGGQGVRWLEEGRVREREGGGVGGHCRR